MFGQQAIAGFQQDGIDVRHVIADPQAPSGVALIFVAADGENSIGVASGANARLSPQDVRQAAPLIAAADTLVMQLETPLETVLAAAEIAAGAKVTVILNPAPAQSLSDALLRHVSILTPNESEAQLLTGMEVTDEQSACAGGRGTAWQRSGYGHRHTGSTGGVGVGRRTDDTGSRHPGDARRHDRGW